MDGIHDGSRAASGEGAGAEEERAQEDRPQEQADMTPTRLPELDRCHGGSQAIDRRSAILRAGPPRWEA